MHLFRVHAARWMVLFAFAALPLALSGCSHDLDDCVGPPSVINYGPAGPAPGLGACGRFAVLGGSAVTNTGMLTTIVGDVGCSPAGAVSGLPVGQPTGGSVHSNDAIAAQGQAALILAYNDLVARPCNVTFSGVDLGGRTLTGGVYCFATSAQLTGTCTLDAQGNSNAVFIFQTGSTLTCATNSAIVLINGAQAKNVFWQIGSSATLGNNCAFRGNLIALTSITMNNGASLTGRALARNGAVTLDDNAVLLP